MVNLNPLPFNPQSPIASLPLIHIACCVDTSLIDLDEGKKVNRICECSRNEKSLRRNELILVKVAFERNWLSFVATVQTSFTHTCVHQFQNMFGECCFRIAVPLRVSNSYSVLSVDVLLLGELGLINYVLAKNDVTC